MQLLRSRLLFTGLMLLVVLPFNSILPTPWWLQGPATLIVVAGMLLAVDRWSEKSDAPRQTITQVFDPAYRALPMTTGRLVQLGWHPPRLRTRPAWPPRQAR